MNDLDGAAQRRLRLVPIRTALVWTVGGAVALLVVMIAVAFLVFGLPGVEHKEQLTIADLFDLLKLAFAVVAGLGGVVALVMAYRRQRVAEAANELAEAANRLAEATQEHRRSVDTATQAHQERIAADARLDAAERRVTDLYAKAADQLGNAKAPVRLAGLYALERLAHGNPAHRQTVVNLLCAYLRMPWAPGTPEAREEREVRTTAQRILATHLRASADEPAPADLWPDVTLDLTEATLVDLDFQDVQVRGPGFTGATFHGTTRFDRAVFPDRAHFERATFHGPARFEQAAFHRWALFAGAALRGPAHFDEARFARRVEFTKASFHDGAFFAGAVFDRTVSFTQATFEQDCSFESVIFGEHGVFGATRFLGGCLLRGAVFRGYADFLRTTFARDVSFAGASFEGGVRFDTVAFAVPANLDRASVADVGGAHERTWPPEWVVRAGAGGKGLLEPRA
jgi:uncharacterized protein YjbI with pentapeptide repeats